MYPGLTITVIHNDSIDIIQIDYVKILDKCTCDSIITGVQIPTLCKGFLPAVQHVELSVFYVVITSLHPGLTITVIHNDSNVQIDNIKIYKGTCDPIYFARNLKE